jgi:hypothetical protein
VPLDYEHIRRCLDEVDRELFRIGERECEFFHQESQLNAFLLLLLRSASLMHPLLVLLPCRDFDGFDAVSRAFGESWYLAYEFRFKSSRQRAKKWLARRKNTWSVSPKTLNKHARRRGHRAPNLDLDYGRLSELAHPTRSAAENSVTLAGTRLGISGAEATIAEALRLAEERIITSLYRLTWLLLRRGC